MDEHVIRELTSEVRRGRLSRRRFIQTMVGVGLTAERRLVGGEPCVPAR